MEFKYYYRICPLSFEITLNKHSEESRFISIEEFKNLVESTNIYNQLSFNLRKLIDFNYDINELKEYLDK